MNKNEYLLFVNFGETIHVLMWFSMTNNYSLKLLNSQILRQEIKS